MTDFEKEVVSKLASLTAVVQGMNERLDRYNGTIVEHAKEIQEIKLSQARSEKQLGMVEPLAARVTIVEAATAAAVTARKTSAAWRSRLEPALWSIIGIIGYVVLIHAADIQKLFAK
jgi:hypothetical protein